MTASILGPESLDHVAPARLTRPQVDAAVRRACARIAPLWPLKHFVACNPYLGLTDLTVLEADRLLSHVGDTRLRMPRDFYAEQLRTGPVGDRHLTLALERVRSRTRSLDWAQRALPQRADVLRERVRGAAAAATVRPELLPTVADLLAVQSGTDWGAFVVEQISQWAGAYFDAGQASWRSPWRDLPPFGAWRDESQHDRTAEVAGIPGFRRVVRSLPGIAHDAILAAAVRLGIGAASLEPYFHRLLMTVPGWAGYARYLEWEGERCGERDEVVAEILAVRLAWEVALLDGSNDRRIHERWEHAREALDPGHADEATAHDVALLTDHVLHEAYEMAWQERFVATFAHGAPHRRAETATPARAAVQAIFCIDVRSEPYRRALESVRPDIATLGFAGFFGVPMEYVTLGEDSGTARCPVLLAPSCIIPEVVDAAPASRTETVGMRRAQARRRARDWRAFSKGAVSSFGFVEALGLGRLLPLVRDAIGRTGPAGNGAASAFRPNLAPAPGDHGATGIAPSHRVQLAEGILRGTSLGSDLARLVVLVGHGATTTNNPHGSALDCGACGGHSGDPNARVAAAILNDPDVRVGLLAQGLRIPDDTLVVAARHDTTTDALELLDVETLPASHAADVAALREAFTEASRRARMQRAPSLGEGAGSEGASATLDARITARASDWSQVRPEWGLARCAAFVAAPRHRTAHLDLEGRAFLHSYDWRRDEGFKVLELIMTAPMVVASWINLQYFGSTTDNERFGSGNKVLHNVVGTLGVVEGNGGDLRSGLPMQSVHDGERPVHEPLRLNVVLEAPIEAITEILERHASVRQLADHRWIHLWAMDEDGTIAWQYAGGGSWWRVFGERALVV